MTRYLGEDGSEGDFNEIQERADIVHAVLTSRWAAEHCYNAHAIISAAEDLDFYIKNGKREKVTTNAPVSKSDTPGDQEADSDAR
jgi:hypothetical protein